MLKTTLDILACPSCRVALQVIVQEKNHGRLMSGLLECPQCALQIPVEQGFSLFTEAVPGGVMDCAQHKLSASREYLSFVHQRHVRRIPDRYAPFQPFNESTRAFYALLDLIRVRLSPGDVILDTWGRTGWSGEMLAAVFPEQHVISIWEGNFDVLGYAGYAHWLPAARRAPNHDILFVAPGGGLPFLDRQFHLVHGLDSLHRYAPATFAGEILRVARADAIIVFPHVHLANSRPQPFFERGGAIVHGRTYQQRFERASARHGRSVMVMAEVALFNAEGTLLTDPETPHYNGVVALLPPQWDGAPLRDANLDICLPQSRAVLNSLLRIDSLDGSATPDPTALGGLMEELLLRHPCYAQRLEQLGAQALDSLQLCILFQLGQLRTLAETAQRLNVSFACVAGAAAQMARQELLQLAPLSGAMSRLQSYYGDQVVRPLPQEETFEYLWQLLPTLYGERPLLISGADGSAFGWDDVALLVPALQRGLWALGVRPGERVAMLCGPHPEATLLGWAVWRCGCVLVPLRKELADNATELDALLRRIAPALLVLDRPRSAAAALAGCPVLLLDDTDGAGEAVAGAPQLADLLPDWLDLPATTTAPAAPDDAAVILFTSGSTGQPKGVVLSQRALLHSGQLAATEFGWHAKDILLSLGEQHTMSGLRNPAVAALFAGATVYIPDDSERLNAGKTLQAAAEHGVTVLAAGPAWLAMLDLLPAHLTGHPAALRQIVSTGTSLSSSLHAALAARMGVVIVDYYGLTETGGLCLVFEHGAGASKAAGRPVGALLQICDVNDNPVGPGVAGELRVHSNQLMSGYWGAAPAPALRGGWLYTGDIASHDGHGRIELLGRRDDQLKNEFGEIVHPTHLEHIMASHPRVSGAALAAGPHGLVGLLVTTDGFDLSDFTAFCRQHTAGAWLPREMRQVDALPVTAAGKLDRQLLARSIQ